MKGGVEVSPLVAYLGIPGAVVAMLTLAKGFVAIGKKVATRQAHRKNLLRLACGLTFERFTDLLGAPVTVSFAELAGNGRKSAIYRSKYAYVLATAPSKDDTVDAYAITVRRKRFKLPIKTLTAYQIDLKLPKSEMQCSIERAWGLRYIVGARRFGYTESYYFGNPGNYQTYLLSYNDAGTGEFPIVPDHHGFANGNLVRPEDTRDGLLEEPLGSWFSGVRATFRPNTVAVIGGQVEVADLLDSIGFGVDQDSVRQIPE